MKTAIDYTTASLAAISLGCLIVLGGCGPQNGEPVPVVAAAPAKTPPRWCRSGPWPVPTSARSATSKP